MNKLKIVIATTCFIAFSQNAAAIPVTDAASVAQKIADAAYHAAQLKLDEELSKAEQKLQEKLSKAGIDFDLELFERQRDEDGYGWKVDVGNEDFYSQEPELKKTGSGYIDKNKTVAEALNDTKVTKEDRKKHNLEATNGEDSPMQRSYDKDIKYRKMLDEAHALNNERLKRIEVLQKAAGMVKTPQAKTDIQIVIQAEQAAISSEMLRLQTIQNIKDQDDRLESARLEKEIYKEFDKLK